MRLNEKKTQVLCISGRLDSEICSHFRAGNETIRSGDKLKILGFIFGNAPSAEMHVRKIEEKFRGKLWTLRFLKKARLPTKDITDLYCLVIRAGIEYCAATYHSLLTRDMSDRIEKLQAKSLKTIFGWNNSYEKVLQMSGLETLETRRQKIFENFAKKTAVNPRFADWFPPAADTGYNTRQLKPYHEEYARTERYKNSPLFAMRRRLNEMTEETRLIRPDG